MKWLALVSALVLGACQCFVPVGEPDSGGAGGSGGSGGSGGAGGSGGTGGSGGSGGASGCVTAQDCAGDAGPLVGACSGRPPVWTCAYQRCVRECGAARTCDGSDGGVCLRCEGVTQCPDTAQCPQMTHLLLEQAAADCSQWTGLLLKAWSLSSRECTWGLELPDGGMAGTVTFYGYGTVSADLPFLGGGCVGQGLPTGLVRFTLSCPACMLTVRPEIIGP